MKKFNGSMSMSEAVRRMVDDSGLPVKAIAAETGKGYTTLYRELDSEDDGAKIGVDTEQAIEKLKNLLNELELSINDLFYIEGNYFTGGIHCAIKLPYKVGSKYYELLKSDNDIKKWDCNTHKTFMNKLVLDGITLCGTRFFKDEIKSKLYERSNKCSHPGCTESNYKKLEVDHIIPWSEGGLTTLDNAQLMCKMHNASKSNKI